MKIKIKIEIRIKDITSLLMLFMIVLLGIVELIDGIQIKIKANRRPKFENILVLYLIFDSIFQLFFINHHIGL